MSRTRFQSLLRFIRFDDHDTRQERQAADKLAAVRNLYEVFSANCRSSCQPGPYLTIDEQLVAFRGNCPFRCYIPTKPGKYGIKVWIMTDAKTAYCSNLHVYTGKIGNQLEQNQGARVVKDIASHLLDSGRNITMDNFFTSTGLAEELLLRQTIIVGTLRKNKRDIPKIFTDPKGRVEYTSEFAFAGKLTRCSYIPKKNRVVIMLSSMHNDDVIDNNSPQKKPEIVLCYNQSKSGVDTLDKLVREYSTRCATRRWPFVLFQSWLDITAYNAFVLYTFKHPDRITGKSARRKFLKELGTDR